MPIQFIDEQIHETFLAPEGRHASIIINEAVRGDFDGTIEIQLSKQLNGADKAIKSYEAYVANYNKAHPGQRPLEISRKDSSGEVRLVINTGDENKPEVAAAIAQDLEKNKIISPGQASGFANKTLGVTQGMHTSHEEVIINGNKYAIEVRESALNKENNIIELTPVGHKPTPEQLLADTQTFREQISAHPDLVGKPSAAASNDVKVSTDANGKRTVSEPRAEERLSKTDFADIGDVKAHGGNQITVAKNITAEAVIAATPLGMQVPVTEKVAVKPVNIERGTDPGITAAVNGDRGADTGVLRKGAMLNKPTPFGEDNYYVHPRSPIPSAPLEAPKLDGAVAMKASQGSNYRDFKGAIQTLPGNFTESELGALQAHLKAGGIESEIAQSTKGNKGFYLEVKNPPAGGVGSIISTVANPNSVVHAQQQQQHQSGPKVLEAPVKTTTVTSPGPSNQATTPPAPPAPFSPADEIWLNGMGVTLDAPAPPSEPTHPAPAKAPTPSQPSAADQSPTSPLETQTSKTTLTADGFVGGASSIYTTFVQGKQAIDDLNKGDYASAAVNGTSALVGATQLVGEHSDAVGKIAQKLELGTVGEVVGVGADLFNAGKNFAQGKDASKATDQAIDSLAHAAVTRGVVAVGGIGATGMLTMVDTGVENGQTMKAAHKAMDAIEADTKTYGNLRGQIDKLGISGLALDASGQVDLNNKDNQAKIKEALDNKSTALAEVMKKNAENFVLAVPVVGNVNIHKLDNLTSMPELNDPEAIRRYANAETEKKLIDVSSAELSHAVDASKFVRGTGEKTAVQEHDDAVVGNRTGIPVKNFTYTVVPSGSYFKSDKFIASEDKNEPLPPEMLKAYKADPEHGRVYEQVLYKKDADGKPLRENGELVVAEIRRWEIIAPDKARQASTGMTSKEEAQAFGSTWDAQRRIEAKEKKNEEMGKWGATFNEFDHAAKEFAKDNPNVTQDALMAKYTQYHNQLKYLKENAQALGLTPEEVKKVNMSMACAEVEFNHAFDPKLQAVKAANEQAQKPASQPEEHKQQPAAVAISDEQKQKALQAAAQFHGAVQGTATYVPAGPQQTGQAQGRA